MPTRQSGSGSLTIYRGHTKVTIDIDNVDFGYHEQQPLLIAMSAEINNNNDAFTGSPASFEDPSVFNEIGKGGEYFSVAAKLTSDNAPTTRLSSPNLSFNTNEFFKAECSGGT
ncbi:MAG: hypothetical protein K2X93_00420 [Candidatus Obscuribacterales bacterium]|nr:hypothetical protein [Candidatus Obscuribacterales bacterium]